MPATLISCTLWPGQAQEPPQRGFYAHMTLWAQDEAALKQFGDVDLRIEARAGALPMLTESEAARFLRDMLRKML